MDLFPPKTPAPSADKLAELQLQEMDDRMRSKKRWKAQLALAAATGRSCGNCSNSGAPLSGLVKCKLMKDFIRRSMALPCAFLPEKFELRSGAPAAESADDSRQGESEKKPHRVRADWE